MKRYRWNGTTFIEIEPDRVTYAERVAAERELDRLKQERDDQDKHPGQYA